jgi:sarcosine oxidase subunit gamma
MAELAHLAARSASLSVLPPQTRFILRGRPEALAAAVPMPPTCRSIPAADCAVLWLGPDEFLLLADGPTVAERLAAALAGVPHALVDVSQRQVGIVVAGPAAADVLSCGCPLDLDPAAFPVGMCTRTVLGKSEITLWRTAPDAFRLEVARSFAAYAWQLLEQGRRDWTA